jgi:hypothetical protein
VSIMSTKTINRALIDRVQQVGHNGKTLAAVLGRTSVGVHLWFRRQRTPARSIRPNLARELQVTPAQLDLLIAGTPVDLPAPVRSGGPVIPSALAS